jgi:hypothetical protein
MIFLSLFKVLHYFDPSRTFLVQSALVFMQSDLIMDYVLLTEMA